MYGHRLFNLPGKALVAWIRDPEPALPSQRHVADVRMQVPHLAPAQPDHRQQVVALPAGSQRDCVGMLAYAGP